MAKKIICMGWLLLACAAGYAQVNVNRLFDEFAKVEGVDKVDIGKFSMTFAGLFADTYGVEGVEVIDLAHAGDEVKQRFAEAVKAVKDNAFETMINTSGDGERTKVMVRIKDDVIHELVVLATGNKPAMVRLKGKIKKSDIEKVVNEHR